MPVKLPLLSLIIVLSQACFGQKEAKENSKDTLPAKSMIPEKPIGWVSDFERVFTLNEATYLDSLINNHEIQTTNEVALVTIQLDSFRIKTPEDFDKFSLSFFKGWGVGKKDKDNGIGILISINLRKIRIEVGYGLESKLTDGEAKKIIDTIIIPEFKNGNYYPGTLYGLKAILKEIE